MVKIYIASSWKNRKMVNALADILIEDYHKVDNFTDSKDGTRFVFDINDLDNPEVLNIVKLLDDERSVRAFEQDKKGLDWCDVCIMLLPCGNSAHLEAGYVKGLGKKLIIYSPTLVTGDYEVMYHFADLVTHEYMFIGEFLDRLDGGKRFID